MDIANFKFTRFPVGERKSLDAIIFMEMQLNAYQKQLDIHYVKYNQDIIKLKEDYRLINDRIKGDGDTELQKLDEEFKVSLEQLKREKIEGYETYKSDWRNVCENGIAPKVLRKFPVISAIKEKVEMARVSAESSYSRQEKILYELYEVRKRIAEKKKEDCLFEQEKKFRDKWHILEREAYERKKEINKEYSDIYKNALPKEEIEEYFAIDHSLFRDEQYKLPLTVPEAIYFGEIRSEMEYNISWEEEISQVLSDEIPSEMYSKDRNKIKIKMPYFQRVDEGFSFLLKCEAKDKERAQDFLKMTVFKLFMSIPAGRLEAIMIDPVDLGETFSMFTPLGENRPETIDTKIRSREWEIQERLGILRDKLETMAGTYGGNSDVRMKKEPFRVLAIMDFPNSFTTDTLKDLQAIIRKSKSYGIFIFIVSYSRDIDDISRSHPEFYEELINTLRIFEMREDGIFFADDRYKGIQYIPDYMAEERKHKAEILKEICVQLEEAPKQNISFEKIYDRLNIDISDPLNWMQNTSIHKISIPIGMDKAEKVISVEIGEKETTTHHALIAGQIGSGKSTLLNTIAMSILLNYPPNEVELYIMDFKEGAMFKQYSQWVLPSIRVFVQNCEPEFALSVLRELEEIRENRSKNFCDGEIELEREVNEKKIPRIVILIDEIQELFRNDADNVISKECAALLIKLTTVGRAAGIHLFIATQNFNMIPDNIRKHLQSNTSIRIALHGSIDSAGSVLGSSNQGIKQLENEPGAAIYNNQNGHTDANKVFRAAKVDNARSNNKMEEYLSTLHRIYTSPAYSGKFNRIPRLFLKEAERNPFNVFNRFINTGKIFSEKSKLFLGNNFSYSAYDGSNVDINSTFYEGFALKYSLNYGENIFLVGRDEKIAASICYFSMLSALYEKLSTRGNENSHALIRLIDLSVPENIVQYLGTDFEHIESLFENEIQAVRKDSMDDLIDDTYEKLKRRINGKEDINVELFFIFFGVNRAYFLIHHNMYERDPYEDNNDSLYKLREIWNYGPKYGIHSIVWGEKLEMLLDFAGKDMERDFSHRIVFASDDDTFRRVTGEDAPRQLEMTNAVYYRDGEETRRFMPYVIPAREWIDKFADAYRDEMYS